jgi:hypothetical protein
MCYCTRMLHIILHPKLHIMARMNDSNHCQKTFGAIASNSNHFQASQHHSKLKRFNHLRWRHDAEPFICRESGGIKDDEDFLWLLVLDFIILMFICVCCCCCCCYRSDLDYYSYHNIIIYCDHHHLFSYSCVCTGARRLLVY